MISHDTQSDMQPNARYAHQTPAQVGMPFVHGGIASASREAIRLILDRYKGEHANLWG